MRSAAVWVMAKAWRGEKTGDGGRQFRGGTSSACAQVAAKRVLCGGRRNPYMLAFLKIVSKNKGRPDQNLGTCTRTDRIAFGLELKIQPSIKP